MATASLDWETPMQVLTGETSAISMFLQFYFWGEAYYSSTDPGFPSESTEERGNFVGFSENVGDAMTFKILSRDTKKIIYRSNVHSAERKETQNKQLDNNVGIQTIFVKSELDDMPTDSETLRPMPDFNPGEMIGRTYLDLPQEDGQKFRMKIIKTIANHKENLDKHPDKEKFLVEA
jgi:hypothetical protein